MKRKRKDFLKGARIVISDHALKRYIIRTESMTEEEYLEVKTLADSGCKESIRTLELEKEMLEKKMRASILTKFLGKGIELRREKTGSKTKRCAFVVQKKGNLFILITTYLQGRREDFWKVGVESEVKDIG